MFPSVAGEVEKGSILPAKVSDFVFIIGSYEGRFVKGKSVHVGLGHIMQSVKVADIFGHLFIQLMQSHTPVLICEYNEVSCKHFWSYLKKKSEKKKLKTRIVNVYTDVLQEVVFNVSSL